MKNSIFFLLISVLCFGPLRPCPAESGLEAKAIPAGNLPVSVRPGLFGDSGLATEDVEGAVVSIDSLAGPLNNSHVFVFGPYSSTLTYEGVLNGKPSFSSGNTGLYFASGEWLLNFLGGIGSEDDVVFTNRTFSSIPPSAGWLDSAGGVANITVEFYSGKYISTNALESSLSGAADKIPTSAAVNDGLAGKASTNGIIEQPEASSIIGWSLIGQSNAEGFPEGTNRLFSAAFTPLTNAFISYIGQKSSTDTNAINYQTNLVYRDYTYNDEISWSFELPIGHGLADAGYANYVYKSPVGGAAAGSFTNGGEWWKYVTNTYQTATNTWGDAPAPTFLIYMRGESGAQTQTQAERVTELSNTYASALAYYGNTNLSMIIVGLPGVPYAYTNGALVDAGSRQFADENERVYFVDIHDLYALHLDQDQMLEAAARIMVPINQILAGKKHSMFEQFEKIGATEVIADEVQARSLKINSRPFIEAVDIVIQSQGEDTNSSLVSAVNAISTLNLALNAPSPVYSNSFSVIARFDTHLTNSLPGGPVLGNEAVALSGGFDSRFGDWVTLTNYPASEEGLFFDDLTISNSDFSVCFWYRREFEHSTNSTLPKNMFNVYRTNGTIEAISIRTSTYITSPSDDRNYQPCVQIYDANNGAVTSYIEYAAPLNEWHHYAMSLDRNGTSSKILFYVDGVLKSTIAPTNDLSATEIHPTYQVGVGARKYTTHSTQSCGGSLADFQYVKRVVNPKEVISLMAGQPIKGVE